MRSTGVSSFDRERGRESLVENSRTLFGIWNTLSSMKLRKVFIEKNLKKT